MTTLSVLWDEARPITAEMTEAVGAAVRQTTGGGSGRRLRGGDGTSSESYRRQNCVKPATVAYIGLLYLLAEANTVFMYARAICLFELLVR